MNKHYLLPVISITFFLLLIVGGNLTGLFVLEPTTINAAITITTNEEDVLPEAAIITITIGEATTTITTKQFIEQTGQTYQLRYGTLPSIAYAGNGYTGKNTYTLSLQQLGLQPNLEPGIYQLLTTITYEEKTISQHIEEIVVP
ncbi:MAG TPA: hypothetical protein VJB87_04890 [Candidatus Nanoarchaeia archaeon]|nr:hypothetical protein [Candidatus Nanoarchaeia archaeon]